MPPLPPAMLTQSVTDAPEAPEQFAVNIPLVSKFVLLLVVIEPKSRSVMLKLQVCACAGRGTSKIASSTSVAMWRFMRGLVRSVLGATRTQPDDSRPRHQ